MRRVVFYSWQSDLPNATNRGFIQGALERAAATVASDAEIDPAERDVVDIDRDTQGVPGSPDIASTIFAKIANADLFVADVSIVSRSPEGRPSPNPNVLLELGYALRALGPDRITMVFNLAFGKLEELPFDLRMKRITTYDMPVQADDRATERKRLAQTLDAALRAGFKHLSPAKDAGPASGRKKVYAAAIDLLRTTSGETFRTSNGVMSMLPGAFWSQKKPDWLKLVRRVGEFDRQDGKFRPFTEPSHFDGEDKVLGDVAEQVLDLYLWSADNHPDFEAIRAKFGLASAAQVREILRQVTPPSGTQETIQEQALRIAQEQQAEQARKRLIAERGPELAAAEATALVDTMVGLADTVGASVERNGQEPRAHFHRDGLTLWVGWHPSKYINVMDEARFETTLWNGHKGLQPVLRAGKEPRPTRTTLYKFDVTPAAQALWRPERSPNASLTSAQVADDAFRQLLEAVEKKRAGGR